MKNVLFAGPQHIKILALNLSVVLVISVNLGFFDEVGFAGALTLLWMAILANGEILSFINRATAWEAIGLVPGYNRKVWITSLYIAVTYIGLGALLAIAMGHLIPPIGVALLFVFVSVAATVYSKRTGSRLGSICWTLILCVALGLPLSLIFEVSELHSSLLVSVSSPLIQLPAIASAAFAAILFRQEIERIIFVKGDDTSHGSERFYINVASRFQFGGWAHPTPHIYLGFIYVIPIFAIIGVSHASFADDGSLLLESRASVISAIAAVIIYIGSGTSFGLLKNPGIWFATMWRFGSGKSRQSLGSTFALNVVNACLVPSVVIFGVAFVHSIYIESPSADWPGYANFYDEAILLMMLNLLCFTWACASYPKRTNECPEFLHIRIVMCAAACLVFIPGVDFGYFVRALLLIALAGSGLLAIRLGGRLIADIDFLPLKKPSGTFAR